MTVTLLGDRYRLEGLIGRGGMATVWEATDTVLDRPVAVKRLHTALISDEELSERFRREARFVARLSHPNLVHLLDRGEDEDGPYLVMELVRGENLKTRIRREGPLDPAEAASIVGQVASALAYAHDQGVVHRDIKAQNVLLGPDGHAKLADFGIARLLEVDGAPGLTRTDMLMGSADYLSPEQAEGTDVDARTDIYSLGIVLYECLTGELPFRGEGFVAVAMRHLTEPLPDPRRIAPAAPAHLAACAMRAAEKEPSARFQSARDLAAALEGSLDENTAVMPVVGSEPPGATALIERPRRRRRRRRMAATGLMALSVAAFAAAAVMLADPFDGGGGDPQGRIGALPFAAVADYDPDGDDRENRSSIGLSHDGDPTTAWSTEGYATPDFRGFRKEGVGVLMRLAEPARATELIVESPTPGAPFLVLSAADAQGNRTELASGELAGGRQTVTLTTDGPRAVYLLWLTGLVEDPDAGKDNPFRVRIGEVELRGVANP